jgi:hypothetical protein
MAGQPFTAEPSHSAPKRTSFFPSLRFGEERFRCWQCRHDLPGITAMMRNHVLKIAHYLQRGNFPAGPKSESLRIRSMFALLKKLQALDSESASDGNSYCLRYSPTTCFDGSDG